MGMSTDHGINTASVLDELHIADIFCGLMAFPNLLALIVLSPVVARCTREYFGKKTSRL